MQTENNNLVFLKDWITFILKFLHSNKENKVLFETMLIRVMKYYNEKDKKEMNFMLMELRSILSTSSKEIQSALDDALKDKFNMVFTDITPISKKYQALNEKQEAEAQFIKDWCLTIIDFIYSKFNVEKSFIDMHKEAFGEERKQKYLRETSPSIYLKGLRMAFNDTNEMARGMKQLEIDELNNLLMNEFGKDLKNHSDKLKVKVKQIIKRGKILNPDEYRLLETRMDEIYADDKNRDEIEKINQLFFEYDKNGKPEI